MGITSHKKNPFNSVRMRMVLIYLGITLAAFIAISGLLSSIVEEFLVSQRTQTQSRETARLALEVAPVFSDANADALYEMVLARAQAMDGRILILDTDAVVQVDSASQGNGLRLPYREVRDILVDGATSSYGYHRISRATEAAGLLSSKEAVWAVYYTAPITSGGTYLGAVIFSTLIQDVADSVQALLRQTTMIFLAMCVAVALTSFFLSGWLTRPIVELTAAIRRMGRKGGARVKVHGGGELAELGDAFNRMSEQIEDHDRVRDEFIANASHELKTPLSAMKILSESMLYQDRPDPAMAKEFFADINNEVDRLSRIITELLRLVQEDTTDAPLVMTQERLDKLVERVMTRLQPLAEKKGIALTITLKPVSCRMEPMRMEQVATNRIENAIKYTDEGAVSVTVGQEQEWAVFSVADTGIGIPEAAIPHVFERFYRVDKARSRGTGGTGLGLAIVREIITRHGGAIEVKSRPGEGSVFTVRLPLGEKGERA